MADERVIIELQADDGSVRKVMGTLKKDAQQAGKQIENGFSRKVLDRFSGGLSSVRNQILGIGAVFGSAFAVRKIIDASITQQDAINKVNTSLRLASRFSQEASRDFQEFASGLQKVTTVGDETTLELLALSSNFARSNEEAKKLTEAAIDLSSATGTSLESSIEQLGKTLTGTAGRLAQTIPGFKDLTSEQLKTGAAFDLVLKRFGGAAAGELKTFSGSIKALSNIFGDFLEVLGDLVVKSPTFIAIVNETSKIIIELSESFSKLTNQKDAFRPIIESMISFSQGVVLYLVAPLELATNAFDTFFRYVRVGIQGLVASVAGLVSGIANLIGADSQLAREFQLFSDSSQELLLKYNEDAKESLGSIFDFDFTAQSDEYVQRIRTAVDNASMAVQESQESLKANVQNTGEVILDISQQYRDSAKAVITQGLSNIGAALAKGENAFGAFTKTVLGVLGDFAINVGGLLIAMGLGLDQLKISLLKFEGAQAIAAGAALLVLGGALKALSGGLGNVGTANTQSTGGGGTTTPVGTDENIVPEINGQDRGSVIVNVEGTVLDPRGVGIQIAEILQDTFGSNGVTVTA